MGLRIALLGAALACLATGAQAAQTKISMVIYTAPGVPFFNPLIKGAQDAAKEADVDLDIQYANNDQVLQNNIIQTAVANKVDGIATVIWDDHAFKKSICDAVHAGIPVIAFNVDNTKGAADSCRLAFIGQDFVTAGYLIGKRMVAAAHLKKRRPGLHACRIPRRGLRDSAARRRAESARRGRRNVRDRRDRRKSA